MNKDLDEENAVMSEGNTHRSRNHKRYLVNALLAVFGVVAIAGVFIGYIYASSPAQVRKPTLDHYHFRMQVLFDGKAENFSADKYQEPYAKDQCSADLPDHPVHFHDQKDQFVHVHWDNMTGGLVLKYYGWDKVGGIDGALGYRFSSPSQINKVPVRGNALPAVSNDTNYYVYTGDESSYKERSFEDFKKQNLEELFGVKSNVPTQEEIKAQTSFLDRFFPKASAHDASNSDGHGATESEEAKLTRINNLLGNVVIFAQKDKPTDDQVKARFATLVPLTNSTCGG